MRMRQALESRARNMRNSAAFNTTAGVMGAEPSLRKGFSR
jgi:hypothetical protein